MKEKKKAIKKFQKQLRNAFVIEKHHKLSVDENLSVFSKEEKKVISKTIQEHLYSGKMVKVLNEIEIHFTWINDRWHNDIVIQKNYN